MGRVRRSGYIFEWWIGDHPPRHVHISDSNGKILGRVALDTLQPQNFPKLEGRALSRPIRERGHDGASPSAARNFGDCSGNGEVLESRLGALTPSERA
jgi:hypothetical protein